MTFGLLFLSSHLVVALVSLVGIGGATRVMEAGLACPDWPLCYGSLLPGGRMNLQVFLEWFHRLDAFLVGVGLLVLFVVSLIQRQHLPRWLPWLSGAALVLVALQGALGAFTVLQLLRFDLVTAHLATALVLVALLSGIHQGLVTSLQAPAQGLIQVQAVAPGHPSAPPWQAPWWLAAAAAAGAVVAQAVTGALMASQWASGSCLAAGEACGWLSLHRQLASPVAGAVLLLASTMVLLPGAQRRLWRFAVAAAALTVLQVLLGVFTLRLALAVPLVTVGHQITAALLVAVLAALAVRGWRSAAPSPVLNLLPLQTSHG
ncbi:COX15/CtaA family protein [Synechococcus sp. Tobar12-5m-g]|uniref:COX15/CtaA family protein n=1 Tax=unclassified Synechococcus TaxID=2626047 RepID=UPI0020CB877D|nr:MULTISPECIES: COX15/CtaA family protein [unclassified Synechococcus]MCP9771472.1 COX15/CtaA family protein [Synechococcus sp. Tobar12-5m-g]MCP9872411.1 COX15/CtaA family protein [Synechococcus sp. Cruz CV-v-12]